MFNRNINVKCKQKANRLFYGMNIKVKKIIYVKYKVV